MYVYVIEVEAKMYRYTSYMTFLFDWRLLIAKGYIVTAYTESAD